MINILNSIIWSTVIICLLFVSVYYSFKLNFLQLNIKKILKPLKNRENFISLSISLGGKIGVGSLSGIAIAIYYGGVGTIFWLWLCSLITSIITYVETYLGVIYKEDNSAGTFYYLRDGLNNHTLSFIYVFILFFTFIIGFNSIQANTIIKCFDNFNISIIRIILLLIFSYIIFIGKKYIGKISSFIVPFMLMIYIIVGTYIIINNYNLIPNIINNIFRSIFNKKTFFSGLIIGVQRAIFATEIGTGTSSIAASSSDDSPNNQGLAQVFGTHFISFIVCSITYLIIILSNYNIVNFNDINGIELISYAFSYHLGNYGKIFLIIITFLFSFSTIISSYYYGEKSLYFLTKVNKIKLLLYKISVLIFIYLGMILSSSFIWNVVDVFMGLLTLINIYAIYKLKDKFKHK